MLDKLKITNFMTFKKLEIPTLKRVNLIAGKNNSGKTTLLDAIRIVISNGNNTVINNILHSRGVLKSGWTDSYDSMFNQSLLTKNPTLTINDLDIRRRVKENKEPIYDLFISDGVPIEDSLNSGYSSDNPRDSLVYIPFVSKFDTLNKLWENVVLTPKEDDVIRILKDTIEPNLIRFDIGSNVRVRLKGLKNPVPIGTLGDGVHRILLIALSLANAQNSILLIDEIELGLHYSAMEKLWQMIFKYAHEWNIQVFATTHSQDAIKTFHYVASDEKYINDAEYIRLQISRKGENEAIIFDGDRLRDSLDLQLEIR